MCAFPIIVLTLSFSHRISHTHKYKYICYHPHTHIILHTHIQSPTPHMLQFPHTGSDWTYRKSEGRHDLRQRQLMKLHHPHKRYRWGDVGYGVDDVWSTWWVELVVCGLRGVCIIAKQYTCPHPTPQTCVHPPPHSLSLSLTHTHTKPLLHTKTGTSGIQEYPAASRR